MCVCVCIDTNILPSTQHLFIKMHSQLHVSAILRPRQAVRVVYMYIKAVCTTVHVIVLRSQSLIILRTRLYVLFLYSCIHH
jgi:hypothetical protein